MAMFGLILAMYFTGKAEWQSLSAAVQAEDTRGRQEAERRTQETKVLHVSLRWSVSYDSAAGTVSDAVYVASGMGLEW